MDHPKRRKMLVIFHILLMPSVGRCVDDLIFETNTADVGDDVNLNCTRQTTDYNAKLFWIRLLSGKMPYVLGGTFSFDHADHVNKSPRFTAEQEPGTFVLRISKTELSDTGLYYCVKVDQLNMIFLKGVFLSVTGQEPGVTIIIQDPLSDPVHPGDSVTLQCSVVSDLDSKTCPAGHSVYWFRAGSNESHPSIIYAHGNGDDECERSPEAHSPQTCVHSLSKTVSSSDAGTYYCAVATCGQILFGKGTKLNIKSLDICELQMIKTALFLLTTTLAISLIIIVLLIYAIKRKTSESCNAAVSMKASAAAVSGDERSEQRGTDSLVVYAPIFKKETGKTKRRYEKTGETVYTDVRTVLTK